MDTLLNSSMLLAVLTVGLFCVSCHYFIKVILRPLPALNATGYSRMALKMKKQYQVFSWGVLTFTFLAGLAISFYQVYTQL